MSEEQKPEDDNNNTGTAGPNPPEGDQNPHSPQEQKSSKYKIYPAKDILSTIIFKPIKRIVKILHEYDGVVTALATVVIAYLTSSLAIDSSRQATFVEGQLQVMKSQLEITKIQIIANIRRDSASLQGNYVNGVIANWTVNPNFQNIGPTIARDFRHWWDIIIVPGPPDSHKTCPMPTVHPEIGPPTIASPGTPIVFSSKELSANDGINAAKSLETIFLAGEVQWRDTFPDDPMHHYIWCVLLFPNDVQRSVFSQFSILEDVE
jgi:hypothetical protein